jgi:PAS domain S-box-containing protein
MTAKTILIVEDSAILAACLQEMLVRLGYVVAGPLASGEEAVTFVTTRQVDLILMDIELAGPMNGITAAEIISKQTHIPIVFFTGYSHNSLLEQAKIADPYGYLIKPVPERELAATLTMALHRYDLGCKLQHSQHALRESERKYRTLADSGQALIWTSGTDKLCDYFNIPWLRFTGKTLEQELGNGWTEGVHPDDFDRCLQTYVSAFDRREKFSMVYRLRRADGEYRWLLDDGTPRFDSAGTFLGYIGHCLDITEQQQNIEALRQSEEKYRRIVQTAQEGIWAMDSRMETTFVNPRLAEMLGYTPEAMLGRPIDDFIYPDDLEDHKLRVRERKQGKDGHYQRRLQHREGHFVWTQVSATAIVDDAGQFNGSFCMFTDISDHKLQEEERKQLQAQLQQAQKMEAIGTLAGGIAHDFNNILSAILGYAEMARDKIPKDTPAARDLTRVLTAGARGAALVEQILTFSRQATGERVLVQPALVIKEAFKLLRPSLPTTIAIDHDIASDTQSILADPTQIHQILINLCTNALHAMEQSGGTLTITLQDHHAEDEQHQNQSKVPRGRFVVLSVADTGTGISPEIRERIFDPYFTTKDAGKGTGMGLAIIHGIVTSYGGFITCASGAGQGTTFRVFFPAVEAQEATAVKPMDMTPAGNRERILYVDDEADLVEMNTTMLERLGYQVTARSNSLEALQTFHDQPDRFDVLITDQTMPMMTGADLARRVLEVRPQMPIILCTGYSNLVDAEQAQALGIRAFAMKPITRQQMAVLLRTVLDNREYQDA